MHASLGMVAFRGLGDRGAKGDQISKYDEGREVIFG